MIYFREKCAVRGNLNCMVLTFEMFGEVNNLRTFTDNFSAPTFDNPIVKMKQNKLTLSIVHQRFKRIKRGLELLKL